MDRSGTDVSPPIRCPLRVGNSSQGENNLEFSHISRSLTFGKRIMPARSRWCQQTQLAQELLQYQESPIRAHGKFNFKPCSKRKYSSGSDNTVKASQDQNQSRASCCCCCCWWSLFLFRSPFLQLIKDQVNWLKLTGSCHSSGWGRSADNRLTAVHCATRRWSWWHWANGHVRFV